MSESGWITPNEKLPLDGQEVLITVDVSEKFATKDLGLIFPFVTMGSYYYKNAECPEAEGWADQNCDNFPEYIKVIAWMPFPDPYKKG